jgi:hypothetical protein
MIHSLALALAKAGWLDAAADGARTTMRKRIEERRKKRQPMDEDYFAPVLRPEVPKTYCH